MGQTKRKRRSKHRGNAVGAVEARGRTSKPAPGAKKQTGGAAAARARAIGPPTWGKALAKSFFGAVLLFALFRVGVLGDAGSTEDALTLSGLALLFYTPIMYLTDRWQYNRRQRALGKQ